MTSSRLLSLTKTKRVIARGVFVLWTAFFYENTLFTYANELSVRSGGEKKKTSPGKQKERERWLVEGEPGIKGKATT